LDWINYQSAQQFEINNQSDDYIDRAHTQQPLKTDIYRARAHGRASAALP